VISDEIYERLVYDGKIHTSFASLSDSLFDRTITINGFSKSHAMTGYRVGYSASNTMIAKAIGKIQSQMTSCASSVSQAAALCALQSTEIQSENWLQHRVYELQEKRDLAYQLILDIPQVTCPKPTGAFYLLPDVSKYYGKNFHDNETGQSIKVTNSHELCMLLLKSKGVAMVSGEAFGDDNCIRLSYATSKEIITESLSRLKDFLLQLK
jgi:aspartate aminotransferase